MTIYSKDTVVEIVKKNGGFHGESVSNHFPTISTGEDFDLENLEILGIKQKKVGGGIARTKTSQKPKNMELYWCFNWVVSGAPQKTLQLLLESPQAEDGHFWAPSFLTLNRRITG